MSAPHDYLRTQPEWLVKELRKTAKALETKAQFAPVPVEGWRVLMSDTLGDIIKGDVEV